MQGMSGVVNSHGDYSPQNGTVEGSTQIGSEGSIQFLEEDGNKKSKAGLSHTAACRKLMMEALMDTPEGRARLEAYEEKVDQAFADRIQASDRTGDAQPRPVPETHEQVSARQPVEDYLPQAAAKP